jgi:DnaA family protein
MTGQLALNLRLRDGSSFENFWPVRNREAVARLQAALAELVRGAGRAEPAFFLWGEAGTGRTHLLEAACRTLGAQGLTAAYVPLTEHARLSPGLLEDRETEALICLDDLDAVAGDPAWEGALFALIERQRSAGGMLLAAARHAPARLGWRLADLASRLSWGPVYQLLALTDEDKLAAVRLRAERRGLDLPEDVARYVLSRHPRDLHSLFALLERLDQVSLAEQRRLTIPFLRSLGV